MYSTLTMNSGSLPSFNLMEIYIRLNWLTRTVLSGLSIRDLSLGLSFGLSSKAQIIICVSKR
jgi:hypothetical protein